MTDLVDVLRFAIDRHGGHTRKDDVTSFVLHPIAVATLLRRHGYSGDVLNAALLHDTIEDTSTTRDEIRELTNDRVADLVWKLTKRRRHRWSDYLERIRGDDEAIAIKLADRICNVRDSLNLKNLDFCRYYLKSTIKNFVPLARGTVFEKEMGEAVRDLIRKVG